jgi:hypothetical protein
MPAPRRRPARERVAEAMDLVASKGDGDGRWSLEVRYPGDMQVDRRGRGPAEPVEHLRALRVLNWYSAGD